MADAALLTLQIQDRVLTLRIQTRTEEAMMLPVQIRIQTETYNLVQTEGFNQIQEQEQIISHNRLHVQEAIILVLKEEVAALQGAVEITCLPKAGVAVQPTQLLHVQALHQRQVAKAVLLQDLLHLHEVLVDHRDVVVIRNSEIKN